MYNVPYTGNNGCACQQDQWKQIALYGVDTYKRLIDFVGAFTQQGACNQPSHTNTQCAASEIASPAQGWTALRDALGSDTKTKQPWGIQAISSGREECEVEGEPNCRMHPAWPDNGLLSFTETDGRAEDGNSQYIDIEIRSGGECFLDRAAERLCVISGV